MANEHDAASAATPDAAPDLALARETLPWAVDETDPVYAIGADGKDVLGFAAFKARGQAQGEAIIAYAVLAANAHEYLELHTRQQAAKLEKLAGAAQAASYQIDDFIGAILGGATDDELREMADRAKKELVPRLRGAISEARQG